MDTWAGIAYTVLLDVCVGWGALLPDQERAALLAVGFRVRQHPAATGAKATPDPLTRPRVYHSARRPTGRPPC